MLYLYYSNLIASKRIINKNRETSSNLFKKIVLYFTSLIYANKKNKKDSVKFTTTS